MAKIDEIRSRLAALTTEGVRSVAVCRSRQDRLRTLKDEVLAQLLALRGEARERAGRSLEARLSLREVWRRRDGGAKRLLEDVQERVTDLLGDKGADAVEAWSRINRRIDERLGSLAELEYELTRAAGEDPAAAPAAGKAASRREANDDDLYAAVGAAVKRGSPADAFCSHCGQGVEPGDRFCRHCGHRGHS